MEKQLTYMIIEYTKSDVEYIDGFVSYLEKGSQEIVDFFNINHLDSKIKVTLWDSLEDFRNKYLKSGCKSSVPNWICGFTNNYDVETLTLGEYRKTSGHEDSNLQDLMHLILHEFTHACSYSISTSNKYYAWLGEGLATTISHQYDDVPLRFNASLDEMIHGCNNYSNYHTMFVYVLDTYGRDYILKLLKDFDLLKNETPRLYEETKNFIDGKNYNIKHQ